MRLLGITSLDQASPSLVNTLDVDYLVQTVPAIPKRLSKL